MGAGARPRITAWPRWARIFGGADARRAPAEDAMAVPHPAAPAVLAMPSFSWRSGQVLTVARARRELTLSVIGARAGVRSAVSGLGEILDASSGATLDDTVLNVSYLLHQLEVAQDCEADYSATLAYALGMPPAAGASPAITRRPRAIEEAREIGEQVRAGLPVILSVADVTAGDARRIFDFAAGLVFGLHGTIERISDRTVLLLPPHGLLNPDDPRDVGYLTQLQAALPAAIETVREVLHGVVELSAPSHRLGWERPLADRIRTYSGGLQALTLPLNLARTDLTGATISLPDLTGAIWTSSTTWPSAGIASQVQAISGELLPGIHQVRGGTNPATGVFLSL
jgi:Cell division protein SepF